MNPMFGRATVDACRVVVRSCEGVLAALPVRGPARAGAGDRGRECCQTAVAACLRTYSCATAPRQHGLQPQLRGSHP